MLGNHHSLLTPANILGIARPTAALGKSDLPHPRFERCAHATYGMRTALRPGSSLPSILYFLERYALGVDAQGKTILPCPWELSVFRVRIG